MKKIRESSFKTVTKGNRALRIGRVSQVNSRYFITTCTFQREAVLTQKGVPELIFEQLIDSKTLFQLIASVVMPDHVHLVFRLKEKSLSQVMQKLKGRIAIAVNKRLGRTGPLWQDGYYDHKLRSEEEIGPILHYMWNNPEIPGMHFRCNRDDWLWFKSKVTKDTSYPKWLSEHPLG